MVARRLLVISVPLNFVWEMLQMPAFVGLPDDALGAAGVCAIAAIGDALIALALWRVASWTFEDPRWFVPPRVGRYAAIVAAGVAFHGAFEWIAVTRLALWTYRPIHPTLPGIGIGILAVLQPLVLLPLTFWLLGRAVPSRV